MAALYRNSFQKGFLSILYSAGAKPLQIWETHIRDGWISRILDPELKALVLDVRGTNVSTTYMVCPKGHDVLGIAMPFLVMVVKNLHKYFTFEVTIVDQSGFKRRFRVANFQSTTKITPSCTSMPICLSSGWNQIQFNLQDFTYKAYKQAFSEVLSVKINANIRIRRIYFASTLVPDDELPTEYRLFRPISRKTYRKLSENKENVPPESEAGEELNEALLETQVEIPGQQVAEPIQQKTESLLEPPAAPVTSEAATDVVTETQTETAEGPAVEAENEPEKAVSKTKSITKHGRKGSRTSRSSRSQMRSSRSSQHEDIVEDAAPVAATAMTSGGDEASAPATSGGEQTSGAVQEDTQASADAPGQSAENKEVVEVAEETAKEGPEVPPDAAADAAPAEAIQEDNPTAETIVSRTTSQQSQQK